MGDNLPIKGIDHIRFFVGNARQAAYFYRNAFGFDVVAYAGLETGSSQEAGYVLKQGGITFVLASPLHSSHPDNRRLVTHGDSVQDVAMVVDDVSATFETAIARGAEPALLPAILRDEHGSVEIASIHAYGDTTHTFLSRAKYNGVFLPGYQAIEPWRYQRQTFHPVGLTGIDHIVGNVDEGKMNQWVHFYEQILGFSQLVHFDDKDISTEYTALMSKVVQDGSGRIKFPLNEPAHGKQRSQIEEYLDFNGGPGVQHIAMTTDDIVATVKAMRANDVSFLKVPPTYYDALPERVGKIAENLGDLRKLGILVDRDDEGYLLQIFTAPVEDRPTVFFEVIERHGSKSFGKGNFKALFEAIEREQERRGTL